MLVPLAFLAAEHWGVVFVVSVEALAEGADVALHGVAEALLTQLKLTVPLAVLELASLRRERERERESVCACVCMRVSV